MTSYKCDGLKNMGNGLYLWTKWLSRLLTFLAGTSSVTGQVTDSAMVSYFQNHQHELRIIDGHLTGSGADWLRHEASQAQFLFIGEEHDQQPIPHLLSALWPDLLPLGYRHVALEAGQWLGNRLDRYTRFDDLEALKQFQAAAWPRRPNVSVPPIAREDLHFYTVIRQNRPLDRGDALIWGLDHEFKVTPLLQRVATLTKSRALREPINQLVSQVKVAEEAGRYNMQPFKASIQSLTHALSPKAGREMSFISDALERRIWGQRFDQERGDVMKQIFLRNYRTAQQTGEKLPKVLLRFGSYHAKRRLMTTYGTSTLANFIAELAFSEGTTMLTVKVVCCESTDTVQSLRPCTPAEQIWLTPMTATAAYAWTLFDLRPLRNDIAQDKQRVSLELTEVVQGYDAVLLLNQYTPSQLPKQP